MTPKLDLPIASTFLCALSVLCGFSKAAEHRPNILVILADDLGWTELFCYGSTFHESPIHAFNDQVSLIISPREFISDIRLAPSSWNQIATQAPQRRVFHGSALPVNPS